MANRGQPLQLVAFRMPAFGDLDVRFQIAMIRVTFTSPFQYRLRR